MLGAAVVKMDLNSIVVFLQGKLRSRIWFIGFLLGIMMLVLVPWIYLSLVRPLSRVTLASQKIAAGLLDVRLPVNGVQETRKLAESFNRMAESLQTSQLNMQTRLKEQKNSL